MADRHGGRSHQSAAAASTAMTLPFVVSRESLIGFPKASHSQCDQQRKGNRRGCLKKRHAAQDPESDAD